MRIRGPVARMNRRAFLHRCAVAGAASLLLAPRLLAAAQKPAHPTPRPGITGEKVLSHDELAGTPKLVKLFDGVRAIPEVVDGLRCNCGCASLPGFYSLLSCYEADGMARDCRVCQGQGRLAVRLHAEGKCLHQIRAAVDATFG